MIAEDEESVRLLATLTIRSKGFTVLAAATAEEAIALWDRHAGEIVLLFSDIVMPGPLTGFDVARHIRATASTLPVIFSSGYSRSLLSDDPELQFGVHYLAKPYRQLELSALITTILAANASRANSLAA